MSTLGVLPSPAVTLVLLGDASSGKSSMIQGFVSGHFPADGMVRGCVEEC